MSLVVGALAALASAAAGQEPDRPAEPPALRGTAGVCIRWGANPDRIEEAVVVVPSGNPALDASIPVTLPRWSWPRGDGAPGRWIGLWISVAEPGDSTREPPDCGKLPPPPPPPTA